MATVTSQTEFKAAIAANDPEIIVSNDISLTSATAIGYGVNIKGEPGVSLLWFPPSISDRFMFVVNAAGNLTIDTLTLDAEGRNGGMIKLDGGTFTMNEGVIIQNIASTTDSNAVRVEASPSGDAGTFIMNGGLITGLNMGMSTAIYCQDGTVTMNGSAAIDNNQGISVTVISTSGSIRSRLTMTGASRISNNRSGQSGAIISMLADIIIGENEGDAPRITGNSSPSNGGGIYAGYASSVSIGQRAEISGNICAVHHGAVMVQNNGTTLHISGQAKIINNKSGVHSGAISIIANAKAVIEGDVEISGNIAGDTTVGAGGGSGGGILLGTGGSLEIKGNVIIHDNTADNGAGIYLATPPNPEAYAPPILIIGEDGSSPAIYSNTARNIGGGILIADTCDATLAGSSIIRDNNAINGKGVYNGGIFKLADSPQILDGLFFDNVVVNSYNDTSQPEPAPKIQLNIQNPEYTPIEFDIMAPFTKNIGIAPKSPARLMFSAKGSGKRLNTAKHANLSASLQSLEQPTPCDWAPIIGKRLTEKAVIQVEASGHVAPVNVPLVLAESDSDVTPLAETDRAAWRIPQNFGPKYSAILNPALDRVLIGFQRFTIVYNGLSGAENPNPVSYAADELPILLSPPGERPGFIFAGWRDAPGNVITEIPSDTTGDFSLTADWEDLYLSFDGNAPCVSNIPQKIRAEEGVAQIPASVPCRPCYTFLGWNEPDSGSGKIYFPGDTVHISGKSLKLYAQWLCVGCCGHEYYR